MSNNTPHSAEVKPSNILPLVTEKVDLDKEETVTFKLRTVAADANSAKYAMTVCVIKGDEGVRPAIQFSRDMGTIKIGLGLPCLSDW